MNHSTVQKSHQPPHFKSVTIQMKATEHYLPVVLFIMLYKVILTSKSVDALEQNFQCFAKY